MRAIGGVSSTYDIMSCVQRENAAQTHCFMLALFLEQYEVGEVGKMCQTLIFVVFRKNDVTCLLMHASRQHPTETVLPQLSSTPM